MDEEGRHTGIRTLGSSEIASEEVSSLGNLHAITHLDLAATIVRVLGLVAILKEVRREEGGGLAA